MPNTNQPRLLSFTLDDWTVLGGRVSVSLQGGVAVLVGRNGAGKSAILEGFEAISLWAIGSNRVRQFDEDSIPKILEIEVLTPSDRKLRYRYELLFSANNPDDIDINNSANDQTDETQFSWNDLCQYIDGEEEVVWSTKAGFTTFNKHDISRFILGNTTSFRQANFPGSLGFKLPDEMEWIYSVLREIRLLGKIPVRRSTKRNLSLLSSSKRRGIRPISSNGLADILARKIFRRINTGEIDELEKVCQRIGLGSKITLQLQTFLSKEEFTEEIRSEDEEYIGSISLDGINIGLLSDGTLRVLSILIEIVGAHLSATTMIDEPEMHTHPGMLARLLNEIETYTFDENLILATQSPQVVAWAKPEVINLVERHQGKTTVRKLQEQEIQSVVEYLCEEGDLGDWLYSGVLDE